jgi:hypothetical protein
MVGGAGPGGRGGGARGLREFRVAIKQRCHIRPGSGQFGDRRSD